MATYRLYPSTGGPSTAVSYTGNFTAGVMFQVSSGGCWFEGYWWWVASNGPTAAQKFALWLVTGPGVGLLIPAATVTRSSLHRRCRGRRRRHLRRRHGSQRQLP